MEIQKKYYEIEDVAKAIKKPASTIRFWESKMPWMAPKVRGSNNKRKYQIDDMALVQQVSNLIGWGMGIKGIVMAHDGRYFQDLYKSLFTLHLKINLNKKIR